jgi:hypothetical protein
MKLKTISQMRDPSKCRAAKPSECPYHGAVISMNAALERMRRSGSNPRDLEIYFVSRKKVEQSEAEVEEATVKQQWMSELVDDSGSQAQTKPYNYQRGQTKPGNNGQRRRTNSPNRKPARVSEPAPARQAVVPSNRNYNPSLFPPQKMLSDEQGNSTVFTRSDQASGIPEGLMLTASRELTPSEREHLAGLLKYQHTIATRDEDGRARPMSQDNLKADQGIRSVYLKTQFTGNPSEVRTFHAGLSTLLQEGSAVRQDGTQKFPAFDPDVEVVVYYKS